MDEDKVTKALAKLREPFLPAQISKRCRSTKKENPKGRCSKCGGWHGLPSIELDYVGHAMLTHRLLEADPEWNWGPLALDDKGYPLIDEDGGMWIRLTVVGLTRLGYGDAQGKTGGDAMKERIGDALRNAAMRFGAALELWHKGDLYVADDALEEIIKKETNKKEPDKKAKGKEKPKNDIGDTPQKVLKTVQEVFGLEAEEEVDLKKKLQSMLYESCAGNAEEAEKLLKKITTFRGTNGNDQWMHLEGIHKASDKWLTKTIHALKKRQETAE